MTRAEELAVPLPERVKYCPDSTAVIGLEAAHTALGLLCYTSVLRNKIRSGQPEDSSVTEVIFSCPITVLSKLLCRPGATYST